MIPAALSMDEFVGRHDELEFLHRRFWSASQGQLQFVLVEGEAGIGKSRLVREFRASLKVSATVACGYCSEHVRVPYLPFTEILQDLDSRKAPAAVRGAASGGDRSAYFNALADVLARESSRKPLALIIEDVQWADSTTLELLRFLLRRLSAARILFLLTLRTEGFARNPGLAALRSAAARAGFESLPLKGLRRNEIRHLVQQRLLRRDLHLDPASVSHIESLAEGNPLFAEELALIAIESGGELRLRQNIPLSLQAILSERLAPFTEEQREALVRAAIIGQTFDVPLLVAISGMKAEDVLVLIQRAVGSGLLGEIDGAPLRFRFHHELIRQALADQLVLALAAPLHVRIAEELEMRADAPQRAAELAYHWSAARIADKARVWNEAAAEAAWSVYAYRDAIRFYSAALRWQYPPGQQRAGIYERLGTLLYIDGCGDEPATWFARCREEYEACGNAAGAARALLLLSDQSWVDAKTSDSLRAAAEAAATLDRLGHEALYGEALLTIARFSMTLGNAAQARSYLRAVARLTRSFDDRAMAMLHEVSGETYANTGEAELALADFRSAARYAQQTAGSELIAQIENNFALAAVDIGEIDFALERHRIALDEAMRTDMMWRIAYCSLNYARTLMLKGDLPHARVLVRQALESAATTATFTTKAAAVGLPIALACGDTALAEACADERAIEFAERSREPQRISSVAAAFAQFYVSQGRHADARALLGRALKEVGTAHRCWEFFLAIAAWGSAEDVALARTMLAAAPGRPRVRRTYALLFEALSLKTKDAQLSRRLALAAARGFGVMGDAFHEKQSLELSGRKQPAPKNGAAKPVRGLTARQAEIAQLVARGETNKSIARILSISEHTVEHHLSDIFERLEIKSRAQLAGILARAGAPI